MPILQFKPPPDFSARDILAIADNVIRAEEKRFGHIDRLDIPFLIMKAILQWEEMKAINPDYGVLKKNESQEPDASPENSQRNQ